MAKPKPVPKQVVCSECGLDWSRHTEGRKTEPTADVCVRLLKADLAKRPRYAQPFISNGNGVYGFNLTSSAVNQ